MSKQQIFNIQALDDPPRIESEFVKETNEKIRKFDEYEENEQAEFGRCIHCADKECNLSTINKLTWSDEHRGFLCGGCLEEEEGAREIEADRKNIIENEKKLHHKGGI